MTEEIKDCDCGICKLRKLLNDDLKGDIEYFQEQIKKIIKNNQERNIELIALCAKKKRGEKI